jgi:hypothetical protein
MCISHCKDKLEEKGPSVIYEIFRYSSSDNKSCRSPQKWSTKLCYLRVTETDLNMGLSAQDLRLSSWDITNLSPAFTLIPCFNYSSIIARGSVVTWGTILQAWRSRVRVPMRWIFLNLPNPFSRIMVLGSTRPLTEISTRNLPGGKGQLVHKTNNLTGDICEQIV